jgi:hypothetical protein
MLEKYTDS